jgi:hypothetical protein
MVGRSVTRLVSRSRRPRSMAAWLAPVGFPMAMALACGPTTSINREISDTTPIGGAMRGTGGTSGRPAPSSPPVTPSTTSSDEPKVPTAVDPVPATADAGAATPPSDDAAVAPPPDAEITEMDALPPPPPLSDARASACAETPAWKPGGTYLGGERVTHGDPAHLFECRAWPAAPWCALPAYEPASREGFWTDAWIDRGKCE